MDRILDSGSNDWGSTPHGRTERERVGDISARSLSVLLFELLRQKVAIYRNFFYLRTVEYNNISKDENLHPWRA